MKAREIPAAGTLVVQFRTWVIPDWSIRIASMFLHAARGRTPSGIDIAVIPVAWSEIDPPAGAAQKLAFRPHQVRAEPEGWLSVEVDPTLIEEIAKKRAHGLAIRVPKTAGLILHSRETSAFSPYLVVTGGRL